MKPFIRDKILWILLNVVTFLAIAAPVLADGAIAGG